MLEIKLPETLDEVRRFFADHVQPDRDDIDDRYFQDHANGKDVTFLAYYDNQPAGYLTVRGKTNHAFYKDQNLPILHDIWVFDNFQRKGIANQLMETGETYLKNKGHTQALIPVGLMASYGAAQRLYVKRGFVPDGRGPMIGNKPAEENDPLNHDMVMWLIKDL